MRTSIIVATIAALAAAPLALAPLAAQAQESAKDMKGPPNANGYGKDDGMAKKGEMKSEEPSGKDMKGPPNANGYEKK